jgi:hypothetical protein
MHQRLLCIVSALVLAAPGASAVGRAGERIVLVADSRRFTGWKAWWINLYNEDHLLFALVTIVTIPAIALVLGRITGWLLARTGINLKSRELAEH